jgi:hypothetical protein
MATNSNPINQENMQQAFPVEVTIILKMKVENKEAVELLTSSDPALSLKTDIEVFLAMEFGLELTGYEGKITQ